MENMLENYRNQKKILMEALVQKDYMEIYQSGILKNDFILKLGEPRYELHKLELKIARTKLKLEMMQTCIQFQIPIDNEHIDRTLEKDFEKHFHMLRVMKKEIESVHNMNVSNWELEKTAMHLKALYISIAEKIHPELSAISDKKSARIWKAAKAAYESKDVKKLEKLQKRVLLEYQDVPELQEEAQQDMKKVVRKMRYKTKSVLSDIENLKKQFPFNEAKLLEDEEALERFKKDISKDIKAARELLDKLEKQILEKLPPTSDLLN